MSIFGQTIGGAGGQITAAEAAAYQIDRSLRFNSADSAYLNRTPSSAGNRKTWTWAGWVKRSGLGNGRFSLFTAGSDGTEFFFEQSTGADSLKFYYYNNSVPAYQGTCSTTGLFRDPSAWYHIVLAVDTTQATAANRCKIYVNGVEQATAFAQDFIQNADLDVNDTVAHNIGKYSASSTHFFSGYLADIHFIDGQALDPTDFGEYDDNNVWQPKTYTFGTNPNNGTTWSDNTTGTAAGVRPFTAAFDGDLSSWFQSAGGLATINFSGLPTITSLEIYGGITTTSDNQFLYVNGVDKSSLFGASAAWVTVPGITSLTSIASNSRSGIGVGFIHAIKVNGYVLLDGAIDNSFHLPFSDNSSNAALGYDSSPNATRLPSVAFDGSGDYLSLADSDDWHFGSGDFTIEAFVYLSSTAAVSTIASQYSPTYSFLFSINGNQPFFYYYGGTTGYFNGGTVPTSKWTHIAVTRSGDVFRIFVDGSQVATTTLASFNFNNVTVPLRIGGDGTYDLNGFMSNVRIIKGTALYTSNFTPPTAPLTAVTNTKLLCCQSSTSATEAAVSPGTITANGDASAGLKGDTDWTVNNLSVAQGNGVYASNVSGSVSPTDPAINMFDSSLSTATAHSALSSTFTWTQTITGVTSLRIYAFVQSASANTVLVNGSYTKTCTVGTGWSTIDLSDVGTTLTSIAFTRGSGGQRFEVSAIEINGSILVDNQLSSGNDSLVDSPTNGTQTDTGAGGEVVGNYATLNPLLSSGGSGTLSNGNLDASYSSGGWYSRVGTIYVSSGKYYWEHTVTSGSSSRYVFTGIATPAYNGADFPGNGAGNSYAWYGNEGNLRPTAQSGWNVTYDNGDVIGVALDMDNGRLFFSKNGTWVNSSDPVNGTNPQVTGLSGYSWAPAVSYYIGYGGTLNTGARPFAYTAPSGFKALCTANLPDPTIADGSTVMDATLYTGNGSTQTISGLNFSPDFVWLKNRANTVGHNLYDVIRGVNKPLITNSTAAEESTNIYGAVSAFNSDGFDVQVGSTDATRANATSTSYVGWAWDGGYPATVSTGAVSFDGSGDYLSIADSADFDLAGNDWTLEAYVYHSSTNFASWEGIISQWVDSSGSDRSFTLETVGLDLEFYYYDTSNNFVGPVQGGALSKNKWHHVAACRSGSTIYMFVDGVMYGSGTSINVNIKNSTNNLTIGGNVAGAGYWNGFISNARIINGTALYTSNFTPPSNELTNVTNTKLLCCQSTTLAGAADVSPNISGINDGIVWSEEATITPPSSGFNSGQGISQAFDGSTTTLASGAGSRDEFFVIDFSRDITVSTSLEVWMSSGASQFKVNDGSFSSSLNNGAWRSLSFTGTLSKLTVKGDSTQTFGDFAPRLSAIRIDGSVILTDPVTRNRNASATTYNPLDAFSVNGTGYSTASAASITEGTIPLTGASVNRSAGFSIVTYSGNSTSGATIGHGLNATPEFIVVKARNTTQGWCVYHSALGATKYIQLDTNSNASTYSGTWNNTAPTSSVFTVGNDNIVNTGYTYVAYCFAPVDGYSAFGSYVGNGLPDGPFVYTGFRPAVIIFKNTDSANNWAIFDSARNSYNVVDNYLLPNTSDYEATASSIQVDFLSNGFKLRGSWQGMNESASTIIYAAWAKSPFKSARAR